MQNDDTPKLRFKRNNLIFDKIIFPLTDSHVKDEMIFNLTLIK